LTLVYETLSFMRNHLKFTICLVFGASLLLGAAPASALKPSWFLPVGTTSAVTPNSADAIGFLTPNAPNTTCVVEYGETTDYAFRADCSNPPTTDNSLQLVRGHMLGVNGLNGNTSYHFRLVATNADGSAATRDATFTTPKGAPLIARPMPLFITDSVATVGSLIKPNGSPLTSCSVEFGLTTAYGSQVDCTQQVLDPAEIAATADRLNLSRSTIYHYRVVAQNDIGVTRSADTTLTTCDGSQDPPTGAC
jgi:hypothetical protein